MEDKLFTLLGLGVPFYLAAATYAVFSWLDSNASDEATNVISSWLHGRSQHKPDLGNLIIKAFDRIYTSPLLSLRAFRRSAAISTIIWLLAFLIPSLVRIAQSWDLVVEGAVASASSIVRTLILEIFILLSITVLVDYMSLLFVRRVLTLAQRYPISASLMSSIIGFLVITVSFIIAITANITVPSWLNPKLMGNFSFNTESFFFLLEAVKPALVPVFFLFTRSAYIIHLWLPLFALSSLFVRLVFWIFRAVEWAQWLLNQGDAHPLKAIGIVATIIVFGSAMFVKEAWTVL